MEIHQLRYLVAVAKTGNFSRAAEQCHVSQPSLSQQIQKLEEELGERLLDRLRRRTVLTPAGARFVKSATRILEELDNAKRELQDERESVRGPIKLGVLPTIAPYFLPPVIASFSRKWPELEFVLHEDTTANLLKSTEACELDFALVSRPIPTQHFESEDLFEEELLVALPQGHPLAAGKSLDLPELFNERFILMKEGHCLGNQVLAFCNNLDFQPRVVFRSAQMETVIAMVTAGLGVSLVPQMARTQSPDSPVFLPLKTPGLTRSITLIWRKQRHHCRALRQFLCELRLAGREFRN